MRRILRLVPLLTLPLALAACGEGGAAAPAPDSATSGLELVFPGRDPSLMWDAEGGLHVAYVADSEAGAAVHYRRLAPGATASATAVRVSPPELEVSAHGETPPALAVLPNGDLWLAYTVRLPGKWKGEIRLQHSTDGGRSWSAPTLLHDDGQVGSHSFLDGAVTADGRAIFSWLDNRDGEQGLQVAVVDGDGPGANKTVDSITCQCCSTELLAESDGRVWLAYRDLEGDGVRDIALAASEDGGVRFQRLGPVSDDGWRIDGCPHTGPRLARYEEALWAVWLTGAEPVGIYAAALADGESAFGSRKLVIAPGDGLTAVSHPELESLPGGRLAVLYEAVGDAGQRIEMRWGTASPGGAWSEPVVVAEDAVYPRLERRGEWAVLAYTRRAAEGTEVVIREVSGYSAV